ncbi:hypothetical protein H5410_012355 [Solanum commersonii]|uniref:Uncharacterized protein n=1 Tax=Solanum commersonii TaxID=4109 RepID=A0A9J6AS52_SOLCO|nr:hypothetical protein H5410_012355 [Solanum commersonii]
MRASKSPQCNHVTEDRLRVSPNLFKNTTHAHRTLPIHRLSPLRFSLKAHQSALPFAFSVIIFRRDPWYSVGKS